MPSIRVGENLHFGTYLVTEVVRLRERNFILIQCFFDSTFSENVEKAIFENISICIIMHALPSRSHFLERAASCPERALSCLE